MPIKGSMVLAFFVGSLPFCFVRPFYGILLWMILAFLNPQSSFWYWWVAYSFPWALAVAIPTMAGCVLFSPGWITRILSREVFVLVFLWIWFTFTTVACQDNPLFAHHVDYTVQQWGLVSKILLMTAFTMAIVNTFARLRILVITVAGCFAFYVAKSLPFVILTGGVFRLYGPDHSMISDNNDFGLAMVMTLPMYFFLASSEHDRRVKWLFGALCLMTIPAVMFTYSRGAMVGLAVLLLMMLFRVRQRAAVMSAVAVAALAIIMLAPPAWKDRMDPSKDNPIDGTGFTRLNAWAVSWNLASEYPITGGGF